MSQLPEYYNCAAPNHGTWKETLICMRCGQCQPLPELMNHVFVCILCDYKNGEDFRDKWERDKKQRMHAYARKMKQFQNKIDQNVRDREQYVKRQSNVRRQIRSLQKEIDRLKRECEITVINCTNIENVKKEYEEDWDRMEISIYADYLKVLRESAGVCHRDIRYLPPVNDKTLSMYFIYRYLCEFASNIRIFIYIIQCNLYIQNIFNVHQIRRLYQDEMNIQQFL